MGAGEEGHRAALGSEVRKADHLISAMLFTLTAPL